MAKEGGTNSAGKETSKKAPVKKAKKAPVKKTKSPVQTKAPGEDRTQAMLLENFVGLQAVLTNLSSKINDLTEKVSKMLDLFEDSAQAIMKSNGKIFGADQNQEVSEKLNKLLDQNKILAQGISLLHEPHQGPEEGTEDMSELPPGPQQDIQAENRQNPAANYQKSISSGYKNA